MWWTVVAGAVLLSVAVGSAAADIVGTARVVDGDTIVVEGVTIRLEGIDAPEHAQTCRGLRGDVAVWRYGRRVASGVPRRAAGRLR